MATVATPQSVFVSWEIFFMLGSIIVIPMSADHPAAMAADP